MSSGRANAVPKAVAKPERNADDLSHCNVLQGASLFWGQVRREPNRAAFFRPSLQYSERDRDEKARRGEHHSAFGIMRDDMTMIRMPVDLVDDGFQVNRYVRCRKLTSEDVDYRFVSSQDPKRTMTLVLLFGALTACKPVNAH